MVSWHLPFIICSWFDRQHTETLICLHHVRLREASGCKPFRQSTLPLPGIGSKAKRNPATSFHDPPYFSHASRGVRPHLHGVNCQYFIECVVFERQALCGAVPQIDVATLNCFSVPSCGLVDHFLRWTNASNISRRRRSCQKLNAHTWPESNLQYSIVWLDVEQADDPHGARLVRSGHDEPT